MCKSILVIGSVSLVLSWCPCSGTIPDSLKHRIDSLKTLLTSADIKTKYAAQFGIAWELFDVDNPVAVGYAQLAYGSAREIGDTATIIKAGRIYGQLLRRTDRMDSAAEILMDVAEISVKSGDEVESAKAYNALAILYLELGRFDKSLVYNFKALRMRRALKDSIGICISLGNIGVTYYKLENFAEAEQYYNEAMMFGESMLTTVLSS